MAGQSLGRQASLTKQPVLVSILQLLCHFDNGDFLRAAVGRILLPWDCFLRAAIGRAGIQVVDFSFVLLYNWSVLLAYSVAASLVLDRSWCVPPPPPCSAAWKLERGLSVFSDHLSGSSS